MTNPQPKITPADDSRRDLIFKICDRLFDHGHCTTNVVLAPANADGTPDWDHAGPASLEALEADAWPADPVVAKRAAVIVDHIDGCDTATSMLVFLREDGNPSMEQIAGPDHDADIAMRIIGRDIGAEPPATPPTPLHESTAKLLADIQKRPVAANDNLPPMHPDPFNPDAAAGLLGDISRWITSTAIIPVPELSLASSIAFLAGVFGKVALTPTKAGVNVYLTTLLGTAGGKGWPAKAIRTLSAQPCTAGSVTNGDPTSYAAMERILRKNASTVVVFDEFGITLQDVNATHKNSVAAGIRKFLLAVYDQSNSVFDGRIYANAETKKDEAPIVGPALTVLGMTTVDTLYAGLSEASVSDGFLNRFLFITASPPEGEISPPKLDHDASAPRELLEAIAAAKSALPVDRTGGKVCVPMVGGNDGEAYKRWGEIFVWQQHAKSEVAARAAENTIRLATLRAISRNPGSPAVDLADVEWGWAITHSSIKLIESGVKRHLSASPAEALRKAILGAIEDAPKGLPYSKLTTKKGVSKVSTRELYDALAWLIMSDQIEDASDNKTPGAGSKFVPKKLE